MHLFDILNDVVPSSARTILSFIIAHDLLPVNNLTRHFHQVFIYYRIAVVWNRTPALFLRCDPYDATVDREALLPFFRNWGEALVNHTVSDPVRAITSAKRKATKENYENIFRYI